MEPEQTIHDIDEASPKLITNTDSPASQKKVKNPKRIEAGKKLQEHNKLAKEKILTDIAEANAKASKADANANEAMTTLKDYLEQHSQPSTLTRPTESSFQQYSIIVSSLLLLAGLYFWATRGTKQSDPTQFAPANESAVFAPANEEQDQQNNDDLYKI